jgi:hypothetical protein
MGVVLFTVAEAADMIFVSGPRIKPNSEANVMTRRALSAVLLSCVLFTPAVPALAAKSTAKKGPTTALVEQILRDESARPTDRRSRLAETLNRTRNLQPTIGVDQAHWQAGYVRAGKEWRSYDSEALTTAESERLRLYREERIEAPSTGEGHLALAAWCRKNSLVDQEQAHLHAALRLSPELITPERLERLHYRQIAGQWLSPEQWRDWQKLITQAEASIERWQPRINTAVEQLGEAGRRKEAILDRLAKTFDESSVPAVEYLVTGQSEDSALLAVEILDRIEGYEASQALAKQSLFSKWRPARDRAREALKPRKLEEFVPALISLLATPIKAEFKLVDAGLHPGMNATPGALYYSLILARETEDQFQVATLKTVNTMATNYLPEGPIGVRTARKADGVFFNPDVFYSSPRSMSFMNRFARGRSEAEQTMRAHVQLQGQMIKEYNDRTGELNGRIGALLAAVSGLPQTSDPKPWWAWWSQHTDTERPGGKLFVSITETQTFGRSTPSRMYVGPMSCFAAGTPVWTETGITPIEEIQVGDRVLSKDVETGALAYLPVIQTTIRPPKELCTVVIGDETIDCTGGHRFWSSGEGWLKARDLAPQTLLHTVTGSAAVESRRTDRSEETYNLVVPDFHTYFVGRAGALVQDLLIPRPTNKTVPGLAARPRP